MNKAVMYNIPPKSLEWYELIFTHGFITIFAYILIPSIIVIFCIYYFILRDKSKKDRDRQ